MPTFNRAGQLRWAMESVLRQTLVDVELVVSDNCSTDDTATVCAELAARDPRVRCVRQPRNLGAVANFNTVLSACGGEYAMLLADDDWLDAEYLERCVAALREDASLVLCCGVARYHDGEAAAGEGVALELSHGDPGRRVARFYRCVADNAAFYGLMPRRISKSLSPMKNRFGADWLRVAEVAALGKVVTVANTAIHRSTHGASRDAQSIAASAGLGRFESRLPYASLAASAVAELLWRSAVHRRLLPSGRARGALAALRSCLRLSLVLHGGQLLRALKGSRLQAVRGG